MKTETIYKRALNNGCEFEATCAGISQYEWDKFMKGATRANKKLACKAALLAGVIDEDYATREIRNSYFNPYNHFKTNTHIIYVHSGIEHFIRVY